MSITTAVSGPAWTIGDHPIGAVLLHGYGADEQDLVGLSAALPAGLPWASPRGPLNLPTGGAAWFPITTPGDPTAAHVAAGTEALWSWIDDALPADARILPIGFSQGGLMATQLLRTRPERIAGLAVLSGFVAAAGEPADALLAATRPPAFWGRGTQDHVITPAAIERTRLWLPRHTTLVERVYPHLGHAIADVELADLTGFVDAVLGDVVASVAELPTR